MKQTLLFLISFLFTTTLVSAQCQSPTFPGVNNITDKKYATRRAGGYPGPGILPGNGRTIFVSIGASF